MPLILLWRANKGGPAEGIWDAENSSLETIGMFGVYGGKFVVQ
jgi:hypothetical protein